MDRLERYDHSEWSDTQLFDEVMYLVEMKNRPYYNEERLAQISRALGRVTFEQMMRYEETHPEAIVPQESELAE